MANPKPDCQMCSKPIEKQFVTIGGKPCHPDCFRCETCNQSLAGKKYVAHEEKFFCEMDYYKKLGNVCAHCEELLQGPFVEAMGQKWHEHHFVCSFCAQPFPGDKFYKHADRPYCEEHYKEAVAEECGKCGKKITGALFEALGKKFHKDCFVCQHDDHLIKEGEAYHEYEGNLICDLHLRKKLSQICSVCSKAIMKEYLSVKGSPVHNACFKCNKCDNLLDPKGAVLAGGEYICFSCAGSGGSSSGGSKESAEAKEESKQDTPAANVGAKIAELETEKAKAIAKEDFDEAKRIKIQIKNLASQASSASTPSSGISVCYTYEMLADKDNLPPGVDVAHREDYLPDDQFIKLLGCNRVTFKKLPKWRQQAKKRECGIF